YLGALTLRGTEDQLASLTIGNVQQTFFGRLEHEYPSEVSLFDVGLRRGPSQTYPEKPDRETHAELFTNRILISGHVESQEKPFLNRALVQLTGLEEWCDATGFSGSLKQVAPDE